MQGDEPEVRETRLHEPVAVRGQLEPFEKAGHLRLEPRRGRRFEVHLAPADGAGDHLHRSGRIVAPGAGADRREAAVAGREKRGMPAEQALARERLRMRAGGVEHHLDHAVDVPIRRRQRADVQAQPAGDGRTHRFGVELLALDLAGLDDILGQHPQGGRVALRQAHVAPCARAVPLGSVHGSERSGQDGEVVAQARPAGSRQM